MMFAFALALGLTFAPIPKPGSYEGQIGVLVTAPEPQVLLLKPNGEVVNRVPLKGIEGKPFAIRLARNSEFAVVSFLIKNDTVSMDYYIPLNGNEKPRQISERETRYGSIYLTSDGKTAYYSIKDKEASQLNPGIDKYKHWKMDVKTGKKEKFDIGADRFIMDLSQDPAHFMLVLEPDENDQRVISLISLETNQIVKSMTGMPPARPLLVANGKSVIMLHTVIENQPMHIVQDFLLRDFGSTDTKSAPLPKENGFIANIRSVSADSESVAYLFQVGATKPIANPAQGNVTSKIVVSNFKKSTVKAIYTLKDGEVIGDINWR